MTYHISIARCKPCKGTGYRVRRVATMTLTTPCRACDRTGREYRWVQGALVRFYQPTPRSFTRLWRNEAGELEEYRVEKP